MGALPPLKDTVAKDAQVILHMLEIGAVQFLHDPMVVGTADIQELSKTHEIVS